MKGSVYQVKDTVGFFSASDYKGRKMRWEGPEAKPVLQLFYHPLPVTAVPKKDTSQNDAGI